MKVFLVRHGQTDWNVERRFQGNLDIGLNDNGRLQAGRLAQRLAGVPLDAIYCSDLARAHDTAVAVATVQGRHVIDVTALRERHYGIFEGMTIPDIAVRHPAELAAWQSYDPDFVIPGGESQAGFSARAVDAVSTVVERSALEGDTTIAVVCHGGLLDMIYRHALVLPLAAPRTCPIPNAAINELNVQDNVYTILTWADSGEAPVGPWQAELRAL